jgi:hypothetical protein
MVRWRALGKRLVVWLVAAAVVAAAAALVYAAPLPTDEGRVDAVDEDPALAVEERDGGYVLADADPDGERVGLVFYPGARVDPAAYLPALAGLVERTDVRVYVPRVPLGFAVLDPGRAADVRTGPDVTVRYVGGHSLGGAMACRYAGENAGRVDGVVLLASYCADDVSDTGLDVLTVTGERDAVVDRSRLAASRERVPADARFVELDGFNHSSFGAYHGQPDDRPATVGDAEADRELTRVLVEWFDNRSAAAG